MKTCENCGNELILVGGSYNVDGDHVIFTQNCKCCGQEYSSIGYIPPSSWTGPEMVEGES